jgi:alanine racemase
LAFIEINKNNLLHNIETIQNSSNKEIFAVIKDNAYGHGIKEIAEILKEAGIKKVCVRNNMEAKLVQNMFEEILVFFPELYYNAMNISYTISDIKSLKRCKHRKIHLKFDTGMHRNALNLEDLDEILEISFSKFEVKGVFSHFCCSDEIGNDTFIQLQRFKELKKRVVEFCNKNSYEIPKFHIANSDAIFKLTQNELFDYVRPGIALYGGMKNENLKSVMSLWGEAIKIMEIKKNQYLGYNKKYKFNKDTKVTLIDLGYSDGILYFDKELTLKETKAVGKISMDSMSVIGEYEKVCIFDDVREFAQNYPYTITYDILTKLKPNIKRIVK